MPTTYGFFTRRDGQLVFLNEEGYTDAIGARIDAGETIVEAYATNHFGRAGFWALTLYSSHRTFSLLTVSGTPLSAADDAQARSMLMSRYPGDAPFVTGSDDTRQVLWGGYAHDAGALAALGVVVVSASGLRPWWRARRIPTGYCRNCRYDLTGNTTGICPECGRAVTLPPRE